MAAQPLKASVDGVDLSDMDEEGYAVVVPVGVPTMPPPSVPPLLIPGSLVPVQLAEPWRRTAAWVIDVVPFAAAAVGLVVLWRGTQVLHAVVRSMFSKNVDNKALGLPSLSLTRPPTSADVVKLMIISLAVLLCFAVWVAYRVLLVTATGRTLGKWVVGIAVVDADDPRRHPTLGQSFKRWLVPQAAGLLPIPLTGMGPYLWVLKDSRRQGLHDRAAKTLVVKRSR